MGSNSIPNLPPLTSQFRSHSNGEDELGSNEDVRKELKTVIGLKALITVKRQKKNKDCLKTKW
jgi:hypothetical protein